jgi:ABC-type transport system substrate-binding protein
MVPFDRVKLPSGNTTRVEPVPDYLPPGTRIPGGKRWTFRPIPGEKNPRPFDATGSDIVSIEPYEQITLARVSEFLQQDPSEPGLTATERARSRFRRLSAAETALASVINFHESRREQKLRDDSAGWGKLVKALKDKLQEVQFAELRALAEAKDWDQAYALATRMSEAYRNRADVREELGRLLASHAEQSVQEENYKNALLRLRLLEEEFPGKGTEKVRGELRRRAKELFDQAQGLEREGKKEEAKQKLESARNAWPDLEGLRDFELRFENRYRILRVGVRELPQFLSPATAVLDSEKWALDLLFEGLLRATTDPTEGTRYEPVLAEDRPQLVPLGRAFQLSRRAYFSDGRRVTAPDVRRTVLLLKQAEWPGRSPEWGDLVRDPYVSGDPFRIELPLSQGYLDPLSLFTFKVLPDVETLARADDKRFAQKPIGSGPYVYQGGDQKEVVFVANPYYGNRDTRHLGKPQIRQIRSFVSTNPVSDFQAGNLHLLPDVPAGLVQALESEELKGKVRVHTLPARRVSFLAVNHRNQLLQNDALRRGLAHAINREGILTKCFRAGHKDWHRPLSGPYPPRCWAANPNLPSDPFSPSAAKVRFEEAAKAGFGSVTLSLKYPDGDDAVRAACEQIAQQVQEVQPNVKVQPVPRKPRELYEDVVVRNDYQLAYFQHDYADESYWLWPLFDPRAVVPGGPNYLGYRGDAELESLFHKLLTHRQPDTVRGIAHDLHRRIFEQMPLIPLWQLDRHVAVHEKLTETGTLDPLAVFANVDDWVLKGR